MKKIVFTVAGVLLLSAVLGGAAAGAAKDTPPARPAWITADNKLDLKKMPDDANVPYHCWNGKVASLKGRIFKQQVAEPPAPGSKQHDLAMAKSKELRKVPGSVVNDELVIDEANPQVQKIMKKYELKEVPECQ